MNWYKISKKVAPNHKYRGKEEIDMNDLCRPDNESIKNIQQLINTDEDIANVHEMNTTQAFREEIKPRLERMETDEFKRDIKPILYEDALVGKFKGDYWWKQMESSFQKFLWPKLSRCREDYLRAFLKGDWDTLAGMIYNDTDRYISSKKSHAKRRPKVKMDINPNKIYTYNPIISTQMKNIGVNRTTFANCIYKDKPEGVQQLYKDQDWQGVADVITRHVEPFKTKKLTKQQLQEVYNETVAQDAFAKQNLNFNQFLKLITGKVRDSAQRHQILLQELIRRGKTDQIMFIINDYFRSVPKVAFPMIYKQYVQPVVPEWRYESFYNTVKINPSIRAAIANEDITTIEQFVEAYRKKIQDQNQFYKPQKPKPRQPRLIHPRQPQETMPYNSAPIGYADKLNMPDMAFASLMRKNIKN